jgi:hypothetical protein
MDMSNLKIAKNLELPLDSVTKTFAIIAQRRRGKTYTATVVGEEMQKAGIPWVALDPTGAWWGLRSSADGKKPGLPVIVFGGDHGDLPLERTAGKMIADLVIEHPGWYILDFSHFESKEAERQLATDFAERFYRRKGTNKTPMHLFVDEADMFAPQRTPAGDQRMLGAFESIVRRGGIRGIGTTLITQRAAVLNKNVLEQIDMLIALRTVGPNDRKAIAGYIEANGTPEQQAEMMGSIASLDLGEAWIWEPGADLFQRVKIRERRTFNSSATPKSGDTPLQAVKLAKVDLEKLRDQIAATIAAVDENDPAKLRERIRELEKLSSKPQVETREIKVPTLSKDDIHELKVAADEMMAVSVRITESLDRWLNPANDTMKHFSIAVDPEYSEMRKEISDERAVLPYKNPTPLKEIKSVNNDTSEAPKLSPGELKILIAAGHYDNGVTRTQLTILTGYKRSTRNTYLQRLQQRNLIDARGERITITDVGIMYLGSNYEPLPTGAALRNKLLNELPVGEKSILQILIGAYPATVSRDTISEQTGYALSSRNTYLQRMSAREIIEVSGSEIKASDVLFQ